MAPVATSTQSLSVVAAFTFDPEPFAERVSDMYGYLYLHTPLAPISEWKDLPWRLTSKHGLDDPKAPGIDLMVRPDRAEHAFNHIALINGGDLWPATKPDEVNDSDSGEMPT